MPRKKTFVVDRRARMFMRYNRLVFKPRRGALEIEFHHGDVHVWTERIERWNGTDAVDLVGIEGKVKLVRSM